MLPGFVILAIGEIPTLDMQTGGAVTQGVLDPWYVALAGLSTLIGVFVIIEIVKKFPIKFKGKGGRLF